MNLKKQITEKNIFLRKAYETAYEYAPSNPLSVSLSPLELGESIGFDKATTKRLMNELVSDKHVQSSIGMGILIVTKLGLDYLREIEDEPVKFHDNTNRKIPKQLYDSIFMKQSEKLDLILKELYKHKNNGGYYSLNEIFIELGIPINIAGQELVNLGNRLKNDGYVDVLRFEINDCIAQITTYGIEYVEEDSYSNSGTSIINNTYNSNISINGSTNANIVNSSSNVSITQSANEANKVVEEIRKAVASDKSIEENKASEILECLDEIQESIDNSRTPKFAVKSLIDLTGGISSISSLVLMLGQYAGAIPIPGM